MEEVVSFMAGKVVTSMCNVAKKEVGYMWNISENVEQLKRETKNLKYMMGRVQQRIEYAESNKERLLEGLEDWVNTAATLISEATKIIDEEAKAKKTCFNLRLCVNLHTLHRYSKVAIKTTSALSKHQEEGDRCFKQSVSIPARTQDIADLFPIKNIENTINTRPTPESPNLYQSENFENIDTSPASGSANFNQKKNLENIDTRPTPQFVSIYQRKNLENIDTHKSTLKEIIQAIEDNNIQIVGISGLGGVGKTTLANEVAAEMKNVFTDIVFITVSQTNDAKRIKEKLEVTTTRRRILNREMVLFILDDVRDELNLEELGIPCGSDYKNCKILLTSRNRDVCEAMNAHKHVHVNPLKGKEAWTLFERVVGKTEWDDALKQVALEIVQECCGLPLYFQVVGNALKDKEIKRWEAALCQLQCKVGGDGAYNRKGIMPLKLGYDCLEDEVTKSCFLLCSMFPEDGAIGLERLTYYGLGLGIFNKPERVEEVVDSLKSSFLLFPEDEDGKQKSFKMHDLVRYMALIITSESNIKFWVQSGRDMREWKPNKDIESYKKISLMENKISKLSNHELLFPHLDTFLIQDNEFSTIPKEFFRGMEKLKVLDVSGNDILNLPRSIKQLKDLRMLDLSGNKSLHEISILGELRCLEILKIRGTKINKFPIEIRRLTKLRVLDLSGNRFLCENCILGKLTCLEILKLERTGITKVPKEIVQLTKLRVLDLSENNFLREISILGKSTCLEILRLRSTKITIIPTEISQLNKLKLLDVYSCEYLSYIAPSVISNLIRLEELYVQLNKEGTCKFLVELSELRSLKILHLLVHELHYIPDDFHFESLKEFHIKDDIIRYQTHPYKHVLQFSKSSSRSAMAIMKLIQVSEMLILWNIEDLENILPDLYQEGSGELRYIGLVRCDNVTRLVHNRSLDTMQTSVTLNAISHMKTTRKFFSQVEEIELKYLGSLVLLWDCPHQYISFCNLVKIKIEYCPSLLQLFPLSEAQGLVNLRNLCISHCDNLAVVISSDEEKTRSETIPIEHDAYIVLNVKVIHLRNLPKLKSIYSGRHIIKYPSLMSMIVEDCPRMKRWGNGDNHLPKLNITKDDTTIHNQINVLEDKLRTMHRDHQAREEELLAQLEANQKRVEDLQVQLTELAANLADQTRLSEKFNAFIRQHH